MYRWLKNTAGRVVLLWGCLATERLSRTLLQILLYSKKKVSAAPLGCAGRRCSIQPRFPLAEIRPSVSQWRRVQLNYLCECFPFQTAQRSSQSFDSAITVIGRRLLFSLYSIIEMSRLTRDGTVELVSRDQILRGEWEQGNINVLCPSDDEENW